MTQSYVYVLARVRVCMCTCMRAYICVWVHVPVDRGGTILDPIDIGPFSDREHYRLTPLPPPSPTLPPLLDFPGFSKDFVE